MVANTTASAHVYWIFNQFLRKNPFHIYIYIYIFLNISKQKNKTPSFKKKFLWEKLFGKISAFLKIYNLVQSSVGPIWRLWTYWCLLKHGPNFRQGRSWLVIFFPLIFLTKKHFWKNWKFFLFLCKCDQFWYYFWGGKKIPKVSISQNWKKNKKKKKKKKKPIPGIKLNFTISNIGLVWIK
jgi:hypothetical protein